MLLKTSLSSILSYLDSAMSPYGVDVHPLMQRLSSPSPQSFRLSRLVKNESLNWKGEEAKESPSEPDHQLVQIDPAALCKKCRKRLQEKNVLSASSTAVRYVGLWMLM